jgi:hypothetical protein
MPAVGAVVRPVGWHKVTDAAGDLAYWQFRDDGRARMVRGARSAYWDWCYVQGSWEAVTSPEFLEWANLGPVPAAVWGEAAFIEQYHTELIARQRAGDTS